jgi:hypothetical protein
MTTNKAPHYPEIVMSSTYSDLTGIVEKENEDQWTYVRTYTDTWKHHINRAGHPRHRIPDDIFRKMIERMNENGIAFSVEAKSAYTGTEVPFEMAGFWDAKRDIEYIRRIVDFGTTCDALEFDGAFFDYTNAGMSNDQAAQAVVDYFRTIHEAYPSMRLFLLFNFPNWGWKGEHAYRTDNGDPMYMGDAYEIYPFLIDILEKNHIPVEGIVIDNPYDYAVAEHELIPKEFAAKDVRSIDWMARILEFEALVHARGLKFFMIFNSQNGGDTDSQRFYRETLAFIELYYQRGGMPDGAEIQSWYPKPEEFLPETSDRTMTGLTRDAIRTIQRLTGNGKEG